MARPTDKPTRPASDHDCGKVPLFERLNYRYGQMLGARDFQCEQDYFRHKMLLQNRCLHGYGVVCGLEVEPVPPGRPEEEQQPEQKQQAESQQADAQAQQPADDEKCPSRVLIRCGLALDSEGHELVVRDPLCVELWEHLSDDDRKDMETKKPCSVYVVLCYHEVQVDKKKVDLTGQCLASNTYTYAKTCESVCVRVTLQPPPDPAADPCDPCCSPPAEKCLWLARIDNFRRYGPISPEDIHNEVRRPLGLYLPTTITGINWVHGAKYSEEDAEQRLEDGLKIVFSRPVLAKTLRPGVMDIWVTDDWTGSSAGSFEALSHDFAIPVDTHTVKELSVKTFHEGLKGNERVLIILRTDFILDRCCRPVDGNHVGGWVPLLPEMEVPEYLQKQQVSPQTFCGPPGRVFGPWTSGNGTPGGTFESWFFVKKKATKRPEKSR